MLKELTAHLREKNTSAAVSRFNEYRHRSTTLGIADYAYMLKFFNENSYLPQIPLWAATGLSLAKPAKLKTKIAAGLYYELAQAHWKMQQRDQVSNAEKALEIAKLAKDDLDRYQALVTKVR